MFSALWPSSKTFNQCDLKKKDNSLSIGPFNSLGKIFLENYKLNSTNNYNEEIHIYKEKLEAKSIFTDDSKCIKQETEFNFDFEEVKIEPNEQDYIIEQVEQENIFEQVEFEPTEQDENNEHAESEDTTLNMTYKINKIDKSTNIIFDENEIKGDNDNITRFESVIEEYMSDLYISDDEEDIINNDYDQPYDQLRSRNNQFYADTYILITMTDN